MGADQAVIMSFDDGLVAASRAAPLLDPSLVYAINQGSSDPADAVETAQATQAFGHSVMFSQSFNDQDPWVQQKILDHLTPAQVGMLQGAGGKPKKKDDGGILGDVLGAVGGAIGTVDHAVATAGSGVLKGLGAPLRFTQHLIRTTGILDENMGQHGWSPWSTDGLSHIFSGSDWAQAWNQSENGEQTFDAGVERDLRRQYGDTAVNWGKKIVGGTMPEDIAKQLPEDQRVGFVENLRTPAWGDLTRRLEAGKLSFGRMMVNSLGISPTGNSALPSWVPILGHKDVANLLSGSLDAGLDPFIDPTLAAAKATGAFRAAKYLVASEGGVETVDRLLTSDSAVKRMISDVSDHLSQSASGDESAIPRLMQRYPQFNPVIPDWSSRGITSQEDLGNWFRTQAEAGALFQGQGGGALPRAFKGMGFQGTMPHLSMTDQALVSAKQKINQAIDWAVERPSATETQRLVSGAGIEDPLTVSQRLQRSVIEPVGNVARSLTTLAPESGPMALDDPKMLTMVQRLTKMGGMATADSDRIVTAFAQAADEAGKKNVYLSAVLSAGKAMGVDDDVMARWAEDAERGIAGQSYAPGTIDRIQMGNDTIPAAIFENQLSHMVDVPSFGEMLANQNRVGFAKAAWGIANNHLMDSFMQKWKSLTVTRPALAVRAGGEEAVGQSLRQGAIGMVRARLAASAAKDLAGPVDNAVLNGFIDHLPEEAQLRISTVADLAGEKWGNTAGKALANWKGALAGEDLTNAAREIAQDVPGALPQELSSLGGTSRYTGDAENVVDMARRGERAKIVWQPGVGHRDYSPTDPGQATAWNYSLNQLVRDRVGQETLKAADLPRDEQIAQVADFLQSPTFQDSWDRALRARVVGADGSQVGVDATERQAAEDWARTAIDARDALLHNSDGERLIDPASLLESGRAPNIRHLQNLGDTPPLISGPDVQPVPKSTYQNIMNWGWDHTVGGPMNWISRQPMYIQNYGAARQDFEPLRSYFESLASPTDEEGALKVATNVDDHLRELARTRALNETIPYIHNPEVRSQFAVYTKNLMPFWFAQEQFVKRWASTFYHSPEAFRKAQLAMNGLRHSGVVHKDDNGNEVFTYPGVDLTADALSALTGVVTGHKVMIPQPLTFNGQVKFATPGTERLGVPSFGPLVSIPLTAMADRFPELQKAQEQILGSRGTGRGYLEQVVPTTVSRLAQVFMANPDTDAQMASAQKQALQYFAAHGKIPDEAASPLDKEKFLDDLKWTARTIALLRTMYGFATPAAPEAQIDPDHITTEFRQLLGSGVPIADAVDELIKQHPDENVTPYTVFQSKSVSGAPIPATADALDQFTNNRDFYASYPNAAAWLLPQKSNDPTFDMTAYRESLALGLRQKKAPDQMLNDIYYAMSATNFFDSLKAKNDLIKANSGPLSVQNRNLINQSWSDFQQRYFDMHPVFADKYQSDQGHINRMQAIDELHAALADPRAPDTTQTGPLLTLLANWDELGDQMGQLQYRRTSFATNQRTDVKNAFATWADNYVTDHPELRGVYDRLFRPELP